MGTNYYEDIGWKKEISDIIFFLLFFLVLANVSWCSKYTQAHKAHTVRSHMTNTRKDRIQGRKGTISRYMLETRDWVCLYKL